MYDDDPYFWLREAMSITYSLCERASLEALLAVACRDARARGVEKLDFLKAVSAIWTDVAHSYGGHEEKRGSGE